MWKLHRFIYRVSAGRIGGRLSDLPVLELTTTGRATGRPRAVLLSFVPDPRGFAVIASNAGADRDPAWWRNLRAHPRAEVRTRREWIPVEAEVLEGDERSAVWNSAVRANPDYGAYEAATDRPIPVILLRRVV